jgi:hypothetical protein|tara:strand:- start:362 stop:628 length:267 start_codon:yes stop_codon:yes gene_type:complete
MSSEYNWTITKDYIESGANTGLTGPSNKSRHTANEASFKMFDDDGKMYYAGTIWGDYDGFEPLDDFGMPNAGCTSIEYKNAGGVWEAL